MTYGEYMESHPYDHLEEPEVLKCELCEQEVKPGHLYSGYCRECIEDDARKRLTRVSAKSFMWDKNKEREFYLGYLWGIDNYDECSQDALHAAMGYFICRDVDGQEALLKEYVGECFDEFLNWLTDDVGIFERR